MPRSATSARGVDALACAIHLHLSSSRTGRRAHLSLDERRRFWKSSACTRRARSACDDFTRRAESRPEISSTSNSILSEPEECRAEFVAARHLLAPRLRGRSRRSGKHLRRDGEHARAHPENRGRAPTRSRIASRSFDLLERARREGRALIAVAMGEAGIADAHPRAFARRVPHLRRARREQRDRARTTRPRTSCCDLYRIDSINERDPHQRTHRLARRSFLLAAHAQRGVRGARHQRRLYSL